MRSEPTTIQATGDSTTEVAVEYGQVNVSTDHRDNAPEDSAWYNPEHARALAAALLRAADEAEDISDPEAMNNLHAHIAEGIDARYAGLLVSDAVATLERWFPMGEGK